MASQTLTLPISGMTFANCAMNVERVLGKKVSGVVAAAVNFAADRAAVDYLPTMVTQDFKAHGGHGAQAQVDGRTLRVGKPRWFEDELVQLSSQTGTRIAELQGQGRTVMVAAEADRILGIIGVSDRIKADSNLAMARLKQMGLETVMLTGDNRLAAEAIARQAGVDQVEAEVRPEDKALQVKALQAE